MHLLAVYTFFFRLYRHIFLACDPKAITLDLLGVCCVRIRSNDLFYFRRLDLTESSIFAFGPTVLSTRCFPERYQGLQMDVRKDAGSRDCRLTSKPWDEAQTLVPSALKMAARSRFPVPTKLQSSKSVSKRVEDALISESTWYQHMLWRRRVSEAVARDR